MGSTAVRYLIQQMLPRPYTLESTKQAVVSQCSVLFNLHQGVASSYLKALVADPVSSC